MPIYIRLLFVGAPGRFTPFRFCEARAGSPYRHSHAVPNRTESITKVPHPPPYLSTPSTSPPNFLPGIFHSPASPHPCTVVPALPGFGKPAASCL